MAIYHLNAQIISRSEGRSCVAAAAYRAKEKILDERTGLEHDFTRRSLEIESNILAPSDAPDWIYERAKLWNEVERVEKRKDAQLSREINIALPKELSKEQNRELANGYAKEMFVNAGIVADLSIHWDKENPHAHIMLSTRAVHENGFGNKNREWNDKVVLESWRDGWARSVNQALAQANIHEVISHKSLKEQGIDREPQIHLGSAVVAMEKKGIDTERGEINKQIAEFNKKVVELEECKRQRGELLEKEKTLGLKYELTEVEKKQLEPVRDSIEEEFSRGAVLSKIEECGDKEKELRADLGAVTKSIGKQNRLQEQIETLQDTRRELSRYSLGHKIVNWSDYKQLKEDEKKEIKNIQKLSGEKKIPSLDSVIETKSAYHLERISLERDIQGIKVHRDELLKAVKVVEEAEKRYVLKNYPKELQRMTYEDVMKLRLYNQTQGRVVDCKDIKRHFEDIGKKCESIKQCVKEIEKRAIKINNAECSLDRYLQSKKDWEKLDKTIFKFGKKYKENVSITKARYQNNENQYNYWQRELGEKFSTKKELEGIKNKHQVEVDKIPTLQKELRDIEPDLKFMGELNYAISESQKLTMDQVIEKFKNKCKEKEKEPSKTKEISRGWDMER